MVKDKNKTWIIPFRENGSSKKASDRDLKQEVNSGLQLNESIMIVLKTSY